MPQNVNMPRLNRCENSFIYKLCVRREGEEFWKGSRCRKPFQVPSEGSTPMHHSTSGIIAAIDANRMIIPTIGQSAAWLAVHPVVLASLIAVSAPGIVDAIM